MIHPSYNELIAAINENAEEDDNTLALNSRYSLVLATSKRARQLISGAKPLVKAEPNKKPLSIAIDEFYKGKVKIYEELSEAEEAALAADNGDTDLLQDPEEARQDNFTADDFTADKADTDEETNPDETGTYAETAGDEETTE